MKRLKSIFRWVVGLSLGCYLIVVLLLSLPFVQSKIGSTIADILSDQFGGTRVEVGRVQLGMSGRLIIDDIHLWDQQGKEMLSAARTGARLALLPLVQNGDIHINNAILFGARATLYQVHPDSLPNYQFVIDAFKSDNKEKTPLPHISIGSLLVRHTSLHYDQLWKAETPGRFNPAHIKVKDLSLAAELDNLTDDELSLTLRKLSFTEESGFSLKSAQAEVERKGKKIKISDFQCATANSDISLPRIEGNLDTKEINGKIKARITAADGKAFLPALGEIGTAIDASFSFLADSTSLQVSDLQIEAEDDAISLDIPNAQVFKSNSSIPNICVNARHIACKTEILDIIKPFVPSLPQKVERIISTLGETAVQGDFAMQDGQAVTEATLTSEQGQLTVKGTLEGKQISGQIQTDGFHLGSILFALQDEHKNSNDSTAIIDHVAFTADGNLTLPSQGAGKESGMSLKSLPTGKLRLAIKEAAIKDYTYHNINLDLKHQGEQCEVRVEAHDPALNADFQGNIQQQHATFALQGLLDVQHFRPQDLHLTKSGIHDLRTKVGLDLAGSELDNLAGDISIPHLIYIDEQGTQTLTSIQLESIVGEEDRSLSLKSPYLSLKVDGDYHWKDVATFCQQTIHSWIPGIVNAPANSLHNDCQARMELTVSDPTPLERIAGIPLYLDEGPLHINALVDSKRKVMEINASTPSLGYNEERLMNLNFTSHSQDENMTTRLSAARIMKQTPVDIDIDITARNQELTTSINWDNHQPSVTKGTIALKGNILREANKLSIEGDILPSTLLITDTLWNIRPTHISFRDNVLRINDFRMAMEDGNRWLAIKGRASKTTEDTLRVNLRGIELGYIFDLVHVKPLSLRGLVSGNLFGTRLFSQPKARGSVTIPHLLFNEGDMGTLNANLAWGVTAGTLDIDGRMRDAENDSWVDVNGYLHLVKDPVQSLDLKIQCQRANLYFLNRYVSGIMDDVEGRATGHLNIFGTFGGIDLSGDAIVNEAALTIPSLNARYHVVDEAISLRPDGLELRNVTGYDPQGNPGTLDHLALINGRISYTHFHDMQYNFDIEGRNVLGYNFPEYGDMPFCGVVYGTGKVNINGKPGQTNIDIDARPTAGTRLSYKVATPETLTQSKFITFVDHNAKQEEEEDEKEKEKEEDKPEGDMHINFNLDITPDAEMELLMDPVAGDNITLHGNSRLRANYYNKGSFRMYGTYRVDHGTYRMSIQDVIRKEFQFRQGGTIVFGGNPFQADLGLQAIYTVPSVSLNDLSARGTFSNNNVRVNCIMNLGGKAGAPRVTFDFDIPNVNDDELRMVRSLISTEEERNLQVIYLLGIGRFYTYDYTGTQAQSSMAMNSLLSSTLSGQLNQMFNSLMGGNQNWNIGANLSTGDMGWSDMDVEGMLSGRLLNNRLLINGNFGYRDNPVAASNFIGDFDLQWILNKQGNLILKAYSETNDRYFTKSALTTQGVGLLLKKDFIRWSDLFRWKKQKTTPPSPEEK